jgi:hypothetical protein
MKYCPLCGAEYQESSDRCASCEAKLVASLDAENVRINPPRLLWKGRDPEEFDVVNAALFEAGIPERAERALGGLIGSITHRDSTIHLLASDLERGFIGQLGQPVNYGRRFATTVLPPVLHHLRCVQAAWRN